MNHDITDRTSQSQKYMQNIDRNGNVYIFPVCAAGSPRIDDLPAFYLTIELDGVECFTCCPAFKTAEGFRDYAAIRSYFSEGAFSVGRRLSVVHETRGRLETERLRSQVPPGNSYFIDIELDGMLTVVLCPAYKTAQGEVDLQTIRDHYFLRGYRVGSVRVCSERSEY